MMISNSSRLYADAMGAQKKVESISTSGKENSGALTVRIDDGHTNGFFVPVEHVILNDAERVNPKKLDVQSPNNGDSILEGLRQMVPFDPLHPQGQILPGRLNNMGSTPAVTQGCILLNMTFGVVPRFNQDDSCALPLPEIQQSMWELVCIGFGSRTCFMADTTSFNPVGNNGRASLDRKFRGDVVSGGEGSVEALALALTIIS